MQYHENHIVPHAHSKLQTTLRLSGRPAYVPSEGKLIADVNTAWSGLDAAEAANKEWMLSELRRYYALSLSLSLSPPPFGFSIFS